MKKHTETIIDYDYFIESDIDVIYYIKGIFLLLH